MAKIKDSHPKTSSGGYERLLKDKQLASILQKAQSTIISNGTELEKIISNQAEVISDLDLFIDEVNHNLVNKGSYLCTKKIVKKSKYKMDKHEPDFIIFVISGEKTCDVVELKDGDSFDTKKSTSELTSLKEFTNHIATLIPFIVRFYICCFNQKDKGKIVEGFKKRFTEEQVMTGEEFCTLLGIDYQRIISDREVDAIDNFNYVIKELTKITALKKAMNEEKRKHIKEDDFYKEE